MADRWNLGRWRVNFDQGWLQRRPGIKHSRVFPDARLMNVLRVLVRHRGDTVSVEDILDAAWSDRVVSRDSVTTAIYQLRQLLGDNAREPSYIVSEPGRGYRIVAAASPAGSTGVLRLALAASVSAVLVTSAWSLSVQQPDYIEVLPMENFVAAPVDEPLFQAIESTFVNELIEIAPGRVRTDGGDTSSLRLESMMVACDLGTTLVMRVQDTKSGAYVWSKNYNLDEIARANNERTLVEQAALDVSNAVL